MRPLEYAVLALAVLACAMTSHAFAGSTDPLFVNLLTDNAHRARMALNLSKNQYERGHPLTIFFNDKGVLVVSKAHAEKFGEQQKVIADLITNGATILVCPLCMQHYGVKETKLIPGAKVGNPELVGNALFKDNTKTLTW